MKIMIARALTLWGVFTCSLVGQNSRSSDSESIRVIDSINGSTLYKAYCAACHGIRGKGDGRVASQLKTSPPDLTRIALRNGGKFPRETVEKIISGEAPRPGTHGTREMPVWGPIFSQIAWDLDLGRVRLRNLAEYIAEMQSK